MIVEPAWQPAADMDVGWIHPWVGLGWVENVPVLVGGFIYAHGIFL